MPLGYGGNCGCHQNAGDKFTTTCQTSVRSTVAGSVAGARRAMKKWLLLGRDCTTRAEHMNKRAAALEVALDSADEAAMDLEALLYGPCVRFRVSG